MGCNRSNLARGQEVNNQQRESLTPKTNQNQNQTYARNARRRASQRDYTVLENKKECIIEEPHLRGIALHQIKKLFQYARARCEEEEWLDEDPNKLGQRVLKEHINLYHLVKEIVKPSTKPRSVSYVEFASASADQQVPQWFVSHYWGERVRDFIVCLDHFNERHLLSPLVPFWICAYALRQNPPGPEIGTGDPTQEPFAKALFAEVVKGTVMILDQPLLVFTRAWCAFEGTLTLQSNKRLDLVVSQSDFCGDGQTCAHMIADGVARGDVNPSIQEIKDQSFPLEVAERGMNISIQDANATRVEDVNRILNCIATGSNSTDAPPYRHDNYERYNDIIRAKFAAVVLRVAITTGAAVSVRRALRAAPHLDLSFRDAQGRTYLEAARLAAASSDEQGRRDIEDYLKQATQTKTPTPTPENATPTTSQGEGREGTTGNSPVQDPQAARASVRNGSKLIAKKSLTQDTLLGRAPSVADAKKDGTDSPQPSREKEDANRTTRRDAILEAPKPSGSKSKPSPRKASPTPASKRDAADLKLPAKATAARDEGSAAKGGGSPVSGGVSPNGDALEGRARARSAPAKKATTKSASSPQASRAQGQKARSAAAAPSSDKSSAAHADVSGASKYKQRRADAREQSPPPATDLRGTE